MILLRRFSLLAMVLMFAPSFGEGMPLPWPFPWAEECPVKWAGLEGSYTLSDTLSPDLIRLTVSYEDGQQVLRLIRTTVQGEVLYRGKAKLADYDREAHLDLHAEDGANTVMGRATLQLHYASNEFLCTMDHLVPILTVDMASDVARGSYQYKLVPVRGAN